MTNNIINILKDNKDLIETCIYTGFISSMTPTIIKECKEYYKEEYKNTEVNKKDLSYKAGKQVGKFIYKTKKVIFNKGPKKKAK